MTGAGHSLGFAEHTNHLLVPSGRRDDLPPNRASLNGYSRLSLLLVVCAVGAAVALTPLIRSIYGATGPASPEDAVEQYLAADRDARFGTAWDLLCSERRYFYRGSRVDYVLSRWSARLEAPDDANFEFTIGRAILGEPGEWLVDVHLEQAGASHRDQFRVTTDDYEYRVC